MKRKNEQSISVEQPETILIETLAYQLWQARGCPEGSPEVDWREAEEQLRDQQVFADLIAA
jgi:hypothetical protein